MLLERLMSSVLSYQQILDHVSDGVYLLDGQRKILYWNHAAEQLTGFTAEEVVGRSCGDNILTHVDQQGCGLCRGMCPAAHTLADGKQRSAEVFLHHKDGHRVAVKISCSAVRDDTGKIIAVAETFTDNAQIGGARATIDQLKRQAMNDLETRLPNRKYAESRLQARLEEMRRYGWQLGVFLAEVDMLAELQKHGDAINGRVLRMVGGSLTNATRSLDCVARWSVGQFIGIVANAPMEQLQQVCERARMMVQTSYLNVPGGPLRATVSIGATASERGDTIESLMRRAEVCLYHSRGQGRNRVTLHTPVSE